MQKSFIAGLLMGISSVAAIAASPAYAQNAGTSRNYDIPSQRLDLALNSFAVQSRLQVMFDPAIARDRKSVALKGSHSPATGLKTLLSGTGLSAVAGAGGVYVIKASLPGESAANDDGAPRARVAMEVEPDSQEIVVTASKRQEQLRDVPSAITALSSAQLDTIGARSFRDFSTVVPGLGQRDLGAPGLGTIILRGLNSGTTLANNTTAFYVDETPFSASGFLSYGAVITPDPDLADVERIEVLKGPQGTLYGAASLGGVVRIISKKPDARRVFGSARIEGVAIDGGGTGFNSRATVNIPIVADRLAISAAGSYRHVPGFADNVGTGSKNVNDSKIAGGRVALRATPNEDLTIDLSALHQRISSDGYAQQENAFGTLTPIFGQRRYSSFFDEQSKIRYTIFNGAIDYSVGVGSVVVSASYGKSDNRLEQDYSNVYGPLVAAVTPPNSGIGSTINVNLKKSTGEVRFISERMGAAEFIIGGFYTHEKSNFSNALTAIDRATGVLAPRNPVLSVNPESTYKEIAGFGNLTFYLSDKLDATGGIRYAHNTQRATLTRGGLIAPGSVTDFKFADSAVTYLGTVRWRPTSSVSTYVRVASGYRPGGPQITVITLPSIPTTIDPDMVWNYEAGLRGSFFDNRLTASASAFRVDWKDIQLNSVVGGFLVLVNGGDARVQGLELEMTARPSRSTTLTLNAGHTDTKLTRLVPGVSAATGAAVGDQLPLTPRWTAALIADQRFALTDALEGSVGATFRYRSHMNSSFPGSVTEPNINIPNMTTLDLRAGMAWQNYKVQLRVENVFDSNAISTVNSARLTPAQRVPNRAVVIRPRTFTLSISTDF